jgi:hypothetical protein
MQGQNKEMDGRTLQMEKYVIHGLDFDANINKQKDIDELTGNLKTYWIFDNIEGSLLLFKAS